VDDVRRVIQVKTAPMMPTELTTSLGSACTPSGRAAYRWAGSVCNRIFPLPTRGNQQSIGRLVPSEPQASASNRSRARRQPAVRNSTLSSGPSWRTTRPSKPTRKTSNIAPFSESTSATKCVMPRCSAIDQDPQQDRASEVGRQLDAETTRRLTATSSGRCARRCARSTANRVQQTALARPRQGRGA
jgi:hypothetical protein